MKKSFRIITRIQTIRKLILYSFFISIISLIDISAQSAIYAGGPIYYNADYSIDELRSSGFSTVIVWTIHINQSGDLNFNGEFLVAKDGLYVGNETYPEFPGNMAKLKTAPTTINRVEVGLSAYSSTTFDNIKTLVNSEGVGENSILYKNFKALIETIPSIDAINFDDESTYDEPSSTKFAVMLADLGYKVALVPYTQSNYWSTLAANTNSQRPGTVDAVYLQCYAGGAGNDPCTWQNYFTDIPVYPGLWDTNDSPLEVEAHMDSWQLSCNIKGGFMWLYDDIKNTSAVAQYAEAINTALNITYNLHGGAGNPMPAPGSIEIDLSTTLSWTAGNNAVSHDVYFGTTIKPEFVTNQADTIYTPLMLQDNTTYYWQVNEITATDTIVGPVWSFTTLYPLPGPARGENPNNGSTEIQITSSLSWTPGEYSSSSDLYLGINENLGAEQFKGNFSETLYQPDSLLPSTTYYWRIDPINKTGKSTGDIWTFTTGEIVTDTSGGALLFDGVDDYVICENDDALKVAGKKITLEAWINPSSFKSQIWQGTIVAKDWTGGAGADYGYALRCGGNGQFDIVLGGGNWSELASPANSVGLNSWTHIAGTYDGSYIRLYVNGEEVSSLRRTFTIINNNALVKIGESSGFAGRVFSGKIDEVRIWNIARTQEEIKQSMTEELPNNILNNESSGLVGYWSFDEKEGQTTLNKSFLKNNSTLGSSSGIDRRDPAWVNSEVIIVVGVARVDTDLPTEYSLSQNYPNPFNPNTNIEFSLPQKSRVNLAIYDILGNKITSLINETKQAGSYNVEVSGLNLASGVYVYSLETDQVALNKKMILLK